MRLRNTLILLGVAAVLVLFIVLFERHQRPKDEADELARRAFPEFDGKTERADAIEIIRGADRIVLVKRDAGTIDEHWRITQPVDYRADASRVLGILGTFERAEKVEMEKDVFQKPISPTGRVDEYGLDRAAHVIVSAGKERLLDCLVGGRTASKDRVYVALASREAVYAVSDEVHDEAFSRADELRDKRLVDLTKGQVTGFSILQGGKPKAQLARRKGGRWYVVSPVADRADRGKVEAIVGRMGSLWADKFVVDFAIDDAQRPEKMAGYGLLPAERSVKVTVELAGESRQHEILFGRKVEKTETSRGSSWDVHAMVAGSRTVVYVPKASVDVIDVTVDDLRDHNVADFSAEEVASVSITRAGGELRLEKREGDWRLAAPEERPAEDDTVRELLDGLSDLRVQKFLPAETKLRAPVTVEVAFERPGGDEGNKTEPRESELLLFEPGEGERIRGRRGKSGAVFEVPSSIIERLEAQPLRFYDRKVLEFNQARLTKLSITVEGRAETGVREGGEWRLEGDGEVDPSRADDIKWALSELKTPEFVAKVEGADLESFGLGAAPVRAVATVRSKRPGGEATSHVLLVGRVQKEDAKDADRRYYARLGEGDVVFLLGEKVVKDLRAGLRKKE